ncbi:hypothetical protein B0T21DRAFT_13699 [Apiosordaria backusii]|uniref:Uncharacterized protein n=1 Tax=Apiosordaria backusii TaxID=314023 RepID=A0AA40EYL8_9PEZI|nr:hypothetical protein B0T21DRAFT_13699 [Apiosordaria backusii]
MAAVTNLYLCACSSLHMWPPAATLTSHRPYANTFTHIHPPDTLLNSPSHHPHPFSSYSRTYLSHSTLSDFLPWPGLTHRSMPCELL